jgi:hypothetical protein
MVNYANSKVYMIQPVGMKGDFYIESTTKKLLSQRMSEHRPQYKRWKDGLTNNVMSYTIFEKYGIDNCEIILLEVVNCKSKDELNAREKQQSSVSCLSACRQSAVGTHYNQVVDHLTSELASLKKKREIMLLDWIMPNSRLSASVGLHPNRAGMNFCLLTTNFPMPHFIA